MPNIIIPEHSHFTDNRDCLCGKCHERGPFERCELPATQRNITVFGFLNSLLCRDYTVAIEYADDNANMLYTIISRFGFELETFFPIDTHLANAPLGRVSYSDDDIAAQLKASFFR